MLKKAPCQTQSEQLRRRVLVDAKLPRTPNPKGVFVGADERIHTLKTLPWKTSIADFSSDSEDELFETNLSKSKPSSKITSNSFVMSETAHPAVKKGAEQAAINRVLSVPETCLL